MLGSAAWEPRDHDLSFALPDWTKVQDRVGRRYGSVLFSNVILFLDTSPVVNELPGQRVILYLRRKIIKTFNLPWLDSGHWGKGKKMGLGLRPLLLRKAWLVILLKYEWLIVPSERWESVCICVTVHVWWDWRSFRQKSLLYEAIISNEGRQIINKIDKSLIREVL